MADLVTHACTALLPGSLVGGRLVGVVTVGTVLPDVASRVPALALELLHRAGVPLPDGILHPWGVLHMPIGVLALCLALPWVFAEHQRARVFGALLLGCSLHIGLDVLQHHHGLGYYLLYPLTDTRYELGLIGSEATVGWAPWLAGATAVAWMVRWLWEPVEDTIYAVREQRFPASVAWDVEHGTDTATFDLWTNYEPTRPDVVRAVLDALGGDLGEWTFVDLGAGKGRVSLMAAQRSFRQVVGVELDERLHAIAERNVTKLGDKLAVPLAFVRADVNSWAAPDGPIALFTFNSFDDAVLASVLERLGERPLKVVLVNPLTAHEAVLEKGLREVTRGGEGEVQEWRLYTR